MLRFDDILSTIHDLSREELLKLRTVLHEELLISAPAVNGSEKRSSELFGLFAEEPELIDSLLESAYEHRARAMRSDEAGK